MAPTPRSLSDRKQRPWPNRGLSRPAIAAMLVTGLLAAVVARYSIRRIFFADVAVEEERKQDTGRKTTWRNIESCGAQASENATGAEKGDGSWKPHVPMAALRRAIAHEGDLLRFDRLIHKVTVLREPITVVGVGSSCLSEFGGRKGPQMELMNLEAFDIVRIVNPDGWLSKSLDWLTSEYPPSRPHRFSNVSFRVDKEEQYSGSDQPQRYWLLNLGIGAVGPQPWAECMGVTHLRLLPKTVDLVVVEWALAASTDSISQPFDAVLQRMLRQWDPPPAFLFVHFFFWCRGNLWCRDYKRVQGKRTDDLVVGPQFEFGWQKLGVFSFDSFDPRHTGRVTEDDFAVIAKYYGFPVLSMRDAFWVLAAQKAPGMKLLDLIKKDDWGLHPTLELAQARYADVVINFFKEAIAGYKERHGGREDSNPASTPSSSAVDSTLLHIPPPFYKRWFPHDFGRREKHLGLCYSYETLFSSAPPVREVQGFNFTQDPDSKHPKPGFATWTAGDYVEYLIDTRAEGKDLLLEDPRKAQANIEVRYLTSYERMGIAEVTCKGGCSCNKLELNGQIEQRWSVPEGKEFPVTQAKDCILRIDARAGKGGSKVKILSVTVSFREEG